MFAFVSIVVLAVILFLKYVYSYWDRNDFPNLKPKIPYGNVKGVAKRTQSFGVAIYELYKATTEPFIGIYLFFRPALLIRDLSLVRKMLLNDFNYFHDRGLYYNEAHDPMSTSLFTLPGKKWRDLRQTMTPAFTSGKIKNMFSTYLAVGQKLQQCIALKAANNEVVDMRDFVTRFVIDIIASVAYGIDIDSFKNPKNDFKVIATDSTSPSFFNNVRGAGIFLCPKILEYLRIHANPKYVEKFFLNLVGNTIEEREKHSTVRKDLMQVLIQLRNTGEIDTENWKVTTTSGAKKTMSIEEIAANVFLFFIAGFATTSASIAYILYEITQQPKLLFKLQSDIAETLQSHNGEITYDSIQDMKYLDLCVKEVTRKYPALPILNRECTKDYKIPNSDKVIKKGTAIIISLLGLHRDPSLFPEPESFNPERFNDPEFNKDAYMPFGEGPRACIAFRMGRIITKVGLVLLLTKFNFEATDFKELKFHEATVGLEPAGGIPLKVSLRTD